MDFLDVETVDVVIVHDEDGTVVVVEIEACVFVELEESGIFPIPAALIGNFPFPSVFAVRLLVGD